MTLAINGRGSIGVSVLLNAPVWFDEYKEEERGRKKAVEGYTPIPTRALIARPILAPMDVT